MGLTDIKAKVAAAPIVLGLWWQPNVMKRGDDIKIMLNRITLRPNQVYRVKSDPFTTWGSLGGLCWGPQMPFSTFGWEHTWNLMVHLGQPAGQAHKHLVELSSTFVQVCEHLTLLMTLSFCCFAVICHALSKAENHRSQVSGRFLTNGFPGKRQVPSLFGLKFSPSLQFKV